MGVGEPMAEHTDISVISTKEGSLQPSWMDHLVGWIDQLPTTPWVYYVAAIVLSAFFVNLVFWVDGSLNIGSIHVESTLFSVFIFYWLASIII
jgi:hypothetical protein